VDVEQLIPVQGQVVEVVAVVEVAAAAHHQQQEVAVVLHVVLSEAEAVADHETAVVEGEGVHRGMVPVLKVPGQEVCSGWMEAEAEADER
jgi:hypothetical protein